MLTVVPPKNDEFIVAAARATSKTKQVHPGITQKTCSLDAQLFWTKGRAAAHCKKRHHSKQVCVYVFMLHLVSHAHTMMNMLACQNVHMSDRVCVRASARV